MNVILNYKKELLVWEDSELYKLKKWLEALTAIVDGMEKSSSCLPAQLGEPVSRATSNMREQLESLKSSYSDIFVHLIAGPLQQPMRVPHPIRLVKKTRSNENI